MSNWAVDKDVNNLIERPEIAEAAQLLIENEVVAFPTETVYGLGANALSYEAIEKIFRAKGRPADNPLIIHIYSEIQLEEIVEDVPANARKLMAAFWPGPLTIIFPKGKNISTNATAGLETVAVRMPDHPIALALIEKANVPIAAPSANRSGKPSPTTAAHVAADLTGHIAGLIDGGPTGIGVESTVVKCTDNEVVVLRPGGITREQLEEVIGEIVSDNSRSDNDKPQSPGMKYTHYSPNAPVYVIRSEASIQPIIDEQRKQGKRVGVLTTVENVDNYEADTIIACGERANLASVAEQLYTTLRQFDEASVDVIISESFPKDGIGEAIMNRLEKAATKLI